MPNGGVLTVTTIKNKESVLFSVKDTGDGYRRISYLSFLRLYLLQSLKARAWA